MNKIMTKISRFAIAGFLPVVLMTSVTPTANAGILDWFKSSNSNTNVSVQTASSAAFVGIGSLTNNTEKINGSVIISDKFLLATNSPSKNSKFQLINYSIARELTIPISAYSSTVDQTDASPFITANGSYVYDGLVAANFLPFGTKIKIPEYFGDKIFTVEDRMNKRYWHKIDVWFPDRKSALEFGHRVLKIQILES